ncbi:hypothetical protein OROMI_023177 [Orobanche minor]
MIMYDLFEKSRARGYTYMPHVWTISSKDSNNKLLTIETSRSFAEVTMPRDALHYGDVKHRELHNAYGCYFHIAELMYSLSVAMEKTDLFFVKSLLSWKSKIRPYLDRDNASDSDQLRVSVPMILTLGLTGMSFSVLISVDFLVIRIQYCWSVSISWVPIIPSLEETAHHDTKRREPWLFGERNTELSDQQEEGQRAIDNTGLRMLAEQVTSVKLRGSLWSEHLKGVIRRSSLALPGTSISFRGKSSSC